MQKNLFKAIISLLVISAVFLFMKKINSPSQEASDEEITQIPISENKLPDDFHTFYNQFHTDSIFQLSRIVFPLKGIAQSKDSTKVIEEVLWARENWVIHRPFNNHEGTFEREFTNTANIISEIISANSGLFTLEKRYAKLSGEWHLIFYQELIMRG